MEGIQLGQTSSPLAVVLGVAFAAIAFVGAQFLGWEWGSGQTIPTVIGVAAAGTAVVLLAIQRLGVLE